MKSHENREKHIIKDKTTPQKKAKTAEQPSNNKKSQQSK